jgi:hypothetical protein|tara:strand:+ start:190 stop:453 length:264 start_codon:yes stop_codon:yes gene_type:complete
MNKVMSKIYTDNSKFMEYIGIRIDEIATRITEERFGEETFAYSSEVGQEDTLMFTEKAHDFYNEVYDEYETLTNNILGLYCNNELNK